MAVFSLLLAWPAMVPFTVGALACATLMGLGNGAVFKLVPEHFPKDTGTVTGLVGALGGLGGFFPPLLLGGFSDPVGVIWPGFVLLSATALALRFANQRVFRPGDVAWSASLPPAARRALERVRAGAWATLVMLGLAAAIVVGSRNLHHFDAALVGYTFATLFATFGITYRYAMWLQRPPTRHVLAAGLAGFFARPDSWGQHRRVPGRRVLVEFAANRFIFRRGRLRGAGALADHVGLRARSRNHLPAGVGMDSFQDCAGRARRVPHVSCSDSRCRTFPSSRWSRS